MASFFAPPSIITISYRHKHFGVFQYTEPWLARFKVSPADVIFPPNSAKKELISRPSIWCLSPCQTIQRRELHFVSCQHETTTTGCTKKKNTQTLAWPRAAAATAAAITAYTWVSVDTSAWRQSKSPRWAVYRWSQGPATGRQAWPHARRPSLPLVATGDRGLLCVELTAPSQRIGTLASLPDLLLLLLLLLQL